MVKAGAANDNLDLCCDFPGPLILSGISKFQGHFG